MGSDCVFSYSAGVHENGDVVLRVRYESDNGFIMSSGECFKETIRPFDEKTLKQLKYLEMTRLADEEMENRKAALRLKLIHRVAAELLGDDFEVPAEYDITC